MSVPVPVADPVRLAVVPVMGVAVFTVMVALDGGGAVVTVTAEVPFILPDVAFMVAVPVVAPAVNRPAVLTVPSPVTDQVKVGCEVMAAPFWS